MASTENLEIKKDQTEPSLFVQQSTLKHPVLSLQINFII
jgi:hypothetical protein